MIPIILLVVIAFFSGVCAYFAKKSYTASCDSWIFYDNILSEAQTTNRKLDELFAFLNLTFKEGFAKRVEEIVKGKYDAIPMTKIIGDDGNSYDVPIDHGF